MIAPALVRHERPAEPTLDVVVRSRHLLVAQAVGEALRRREVLARVVPWEATVHPGERLGDVVLLIDEMDSRSAVEEVREVVAQTPVPVLVLTARPTSTAWGGALEAGAAAILPKGATLDAVEEALDLLTGEVPLMPEGQKSALVEEWRVWDAEEHDLERRLATLSTRETEVLGLLSGGHRVSDIADTLGVSESTVRTQVKSMRRKLGVDSQLAAVAVARRVADDALDVGPMVPAPR